MGILRPGKYTFGNKTKTEILNLTAPLTLTGTCSISIGSTTLTGVGTLFTQELFVGNIIRVSTSVFRIATIVSNTSLTIDLASASTIAAGTPITLLNPKGIKKGDSVFNTTDRFPMYYTGDSGCFTLPSGAFEKWKLGTWSNGQISAIKMLQGSTILEGNVLTTTSVNVNPYSSGSVDTAAAMSYFSVLYDESCCATANCGIHNTDSSGAIAKGNFTKPSLSASTPAVVLDSTTSASGDSCGVACTSTGTPAAGELEMLVNFQERL